MHPQRPDGPHYQTAWQAFTGLFDKKRRGKPTPQDQQDDGEQDSQEDDLINRKKPQ